MSLVAVGGLMPMPVGHGGRDYGLSAGNLGSNTIAATLAAVEMYGYLVTEDGGSHTIDTSGSSAIGWRSGATTFANVGSVLRVGLAAVDTANGPPGRAANAAGAVSFDVYKEFVTASGPTSNAWNETVPSSGTKTIANGDLVAFVVQFVTRAGADSVIAQAEASVLANSLPSTTTFDGTSTYTAVNQHPNVVITFSDGTLGFFSGGFVATTAVTTITWSSGSATKEYGNYLMLPFPAKIYGIYGTMNFSANCDVVLYSDPLGTPVAEKTVSIDLNTVSASSTLKPFLVPFQTPYTTIASQPLGVIFKPGASSAAAVHRTFNASAHQKSLGCGANGYAINRASGAFAAQNSNKDRFDIGLLVGAFDDAVNTTPVGRFISAQRGQPY